MLEDITARLSGFGYSVKEEDAWTLRFTMEKVENQIKLQCNTTSIPEGLLNIAVDMVVGEFLMIKKSTGQDIGIDIEAMEKSIQEGDTTVTYAIGDGDKTSEQRVDELIQYLLNHGKSDFVLYRSLSW